MRTISTAIAAVLEQLELDQPLLVSSADLDKTRKETNSSTTTKYLIDELTAEGWLLPLRTRGYWEFAPAARAGAIDAGDPHIELRATLLKRPELPAVIAAESAAWLHGLSARSPNRHTIAASPGIRLPPALSEYRVIRYEAKLEPEANNGLPIWTVPTLLVAMSHRPASYRDWPNVTDWLAQAVRRATEDELLTELSEKPRSTWMRLAYLLHQGRQEEIAENLHAAAPGGKGPYYLGPRDQRGRHDSQYDVIDSALVEQAP